jgi:hypothetical protein
VIATLALLAATATAPLGAPGPPPGNGVDLPASPGTAPPFVPPGTAATLPAVTSGPGLLNDAGVPVNRARRTFALKLACQTDGRLRISSRRLTPGTLARGRYRCAAGRAIARLTLSRTTVKRLDRRKRVPATARVTQSGRASALDFTLTAGRLPARTKGFWTDGHLDCQGAYLVEPDFTTVSATPISTRGWIAWYTTRGGWHWLGTDGEGNGRWDTWTATPTGIAQFHPGGQRTPVPWTWGPIAVPPGQGVYAVGVYEIVYWVGGHPGHQWQYVNAGTTGAAAAGGGQLYCVYA